MGIDLGNIPTNLELFASHLDRSKLVQEYLRLIYLGPNYHETIWE